MDRHLLLFLLLQMCGNACSQQVEVCPRTVINSCDDCIRAGPYCVWCQKLNFTKHGEQEAARCDTRLQLLARGCAEEHIISTKNYLEVVKEAPLSKSFEQREKQQEPVQLQPQEVHLKLKPGLPSTFTLAFKRVEGYPVDLYYLMDLSNSMDDDLRNVQGLGQDLFAALKSITEHGQIGFGSFVDKTVLPFTNTNKKKLQKPCKEDEQFCQPPFGFRHVLSMTANEEEFNQEVKKQNISGNLDSPEGSLDAMMQAVVCGDKVGWRNSSTRLIVLTTDAGFHMAGDGKLAGILEPNDEQCHMENHLYVKSNELDYPSVGQLAAQLALNNIQTIFAVTQDMEHVYTQLSQMIPKSAVEVLSSDSENIVDLIRKAYNSLSSKVTMTHNDLPDGVRVTYTPNCEGGLIGDTRGVCDNVAVGKEISFNVTVTADECIAEKSFMISPLGIKDTLKVVVSTNCKCECNDPGDEGLSHCNYKGQVICGICSCKSGFVGQNCECSKGDDKVSQQASCSKDNSTKCMGRGECVCGRCQCYNTKRGSSYHGDFCECDDELCEKFQNLLCGGNGQCNCGKCICKPEYDGSACHCLKSDELCRTGAFVCSGRGKCVCNQCECNEGYRRPFCDICHGCPDSCQSKQKCIECQAFGTLSENCTLVCKGSVEHTMVDMFTKTKKQCRQKDAEGCFITFQIEQLMGEDRYRAEVLRTRECPEEPNIYAIIGGSIAVVAFIGMLILLLIKVLIYMKDLKEFQKFENEKKKSKWAPADNPLFKNATTTVANPTFTG